MDINQFRNNVRIAITDEFINGLLDKYVNSNVKFLTDKQSIRDLFKFDPSSKGLVNESDFIAFKDQLISYELENQTFNSEDKKQIINEINAKLINTINRSNQLVFSTDGLLKQDNANDLEHKFIINAPAREFVSILKAIFDATVANSLDGIRIVTPAITKVKLGYSDSIIVICNTMDLEKTVQMLDSIPVMYKDKCGATSLLCANLDNWLGYETIDLENRISASKVLSDSFLVALDQAIEKFAKANILMRFGDNSLSYSDYKLSFNNINLFRQTMIKSYRDKLTPMFIEEFKSVLKSKGVDLADIFNNDNTKKRCDDAYGVLEISSVDVDAEVKEEELTISTPVSIMIEEDKKDVVSLEEESGKSELDDLLKFVQQDVDSQGEEYLSVEKEFGKVKDINPRDMEIPDFLKRKPVEVIDEVNIESTDEFNSEVPEVDSIQDVEFVDETTVPEETSMIEDIQPQENVVLEETSQSGLEGIESLSENMESNNEIVAESQVDNIQEVEDPQEFAREIFGEKGYVEVNPEEEISVLELFNKPDESKLVRPTTAEIVEAMEHGNNITYQPSAEEMAVVMENANIQENIVDVGIPLAEEGQLTEEEISSIVDDGLVVENPNVGATYETALKYKDVVRDISQLNNIVKGTDMTVLQYFEQYNLLNQIAPDSVVVMHDNFGGKKAAIDFVSDDLINYLVQNGQGDLDYVIGLYAESIEKEQVAKKSKGLFGLFRK